jgi:hypothetical protein
MAKREKEKHLEKKAKILAMALKEGGGKTRGQKGVPNRREQRNPVGKIQCTYLRRRDMVGSHQVRHQFLYVPEAPGPLLGRHLLSKLGTTVSMDLGLPGVSTLPVLTLEVSLEEE